MTARPSRIVVIRSVHTVENHLLVNLEAINGATMISRVWRGFTNRVNADAYETLLRSKVLPGIRRVRGYRGAYLLRRDAGVEVEFVTITRFDDLDAVRAFAGDDYAAAVVLPEAERLLSHYDERVAHYETVLAPESE
jgi:antibiotic biosynthesis monooxygenase (ABM) superfamily enzyme